MRLEVDSGEYFPHLFITRPCDTSDPASVYEVPDPLAAALQAASDALSAAEQAVLLHLLDTGQADGTTLVIARHLTGNTTDAEELA